MSSARLQSYPSEVTVAAARGRAGGLVHNIQALRGVAALMVVLGHAEGMQIIRLPFVVGWVAYSGVDIFFVISGFIIATVGEHERFDEFLVKRLGRIFPLYWLMLLVASLISLKVFLGESWMGREPSIDYIFLLTRTNIYIAPAWTLAFELYFYVMVTLVIAIAPKLFFQAMFLLIGVQVYVVAITIISREQPGINFFTSPLVLEFGLGVAIAYAVKRGWLKFGAAALGLAVCFFAAGYAWSRMSGNLLDDSQRSLVFGVGSGLLVYGLVALEKSGRLVLRGRAWLQLGAASYAIYLLHYPILKLVDRQFPAARAVGWLVLLAIVAVAFAIHHLWEKPCLNFARSASRRLAAARV